MVQDIFNQVLRLNEVTSQLIVDIYAKIETEKFGLHMKKSKKKKINKLRVEDYTHLQDSMHSDGDYKNIG